MLRVQRLVPRVAPRAAGAPGFARWSAKRFVDWSFGHYLNIAHPDFVTAGSAPARAPARATAAV